MSRAIRLIIHPIVVSVNCYARLAAQFFSFNTISSMQHPIFMGFHVTSSTIDPAIVHWTQVFLILDNLEVHHARIVTAWLGARRDRRKYSSDLNSDECLNADLKAAVTRAAPVRRKGQLEKAVISRIRKIAKPSQRVQKYFEHPQVKYAV